MKRLLLILFGFCLSLPTYADGWAIIDTVGIVSVEIDADNSVRSNQQLSKVAKKIHKIAETLNQLASKDCIFQKIELYETGPNGFIAMGGEFEMQGNIPQLIGLGITLPAGLFQEKIVLQLYRYAISIKDQLFYEEVKNLVDSTLLKRANIIP